MYHREMRSNGSGKITRLRIPEYLFPVRMIYFTIPSRNRDIMREPFFRMIAYVIKESAKCKISMNDIINTIILSTVF